MTIRGCSALTAGGVGGGVVGWWWAGEPPQVPVKETCGMWLAHAPRGEGRAKRDGRITGGRWWEGDQ